MGEIAEALRRARESDRGHRAQPTNPSAVVEFGEPQLSDRVLPATEPVTISSEHEVGTAWSARAVLALPQGPVAEQYRHFAIRVSRRLKQRGARIVGVTSASRSEGKTTTACNLALALASVSGGRRVALLDLDLRRPSAAESLGVSVRSGVEELLVGRASLGDVRLATQLADLDLYLVKRNVRDPLHLISGPQLPALLRELARRYDTVVVDTPPVLPVPDVPLLLPLIDAVIVVARNGFSRSGAFRDLITTIGTERVLGAFLNESNLPRHHRYYGYYGNEAKAADAERGEERGE